MEDKQRQALYIPPSANKQSEHSVVSAEESHRWNILYKSFLAVGLGLVAPPVGGVHYGGARPPQVAVCSQQLPKEEDDPLHNPFSYNSVQTNQAGRDAFDLMEKHGNFLEALTLLDDHESKEFYDAATTVIRAYVELKRVKEAKEITEETRKLMEQLHLDYPSGLAG